MSLPQSARALQAATTASASPECIPLVIRRQILPVFGQGAVLAFRKHRKVKGLR